MVIEEHIPLLEDILADWKTQLGQDHLAYKNHVYRVIHFCLALHTATGNAREKIVIAACFHDLGIWSDRTVDYLPPSVQLAAEYLSGRGLDRWIPEISLMIAMHHKLRKYENPELPLVEVFRQADLVDLSLGLVRCGLPKDYVRNVKSAFPNAGFHKALGRLAAGWFSKHPLSPPPFIKW